MRCCDTVFTTVESLGRHVVKKHPGCCFSRFGGDLLELDSEPVAETRQPSIHLWNGGLMVVARRVGSNIYEVARPSWVLGMMPSIMIGNDGIAPVWNLMW